MDWKFLARQLDDALRTLQPQHQLISLTLPLSVAPSVHLGKNGCFWHRGNLTLSGSGYALSVDVSGADRMASLSTALRKLLSGWHATIAPSPLAFTGFSFDPRISQSQPLPDALLWVPELLLRTTDSQTWVTFSCTPNRAGQALGNWQQRWNDWQPPPPCSAHTLCSYSSSDPDFLARGHAALEAIAAGEVQKLVLTRALHLQTDAPVALQSVLEYLAAHYPTCATTGISCEGWAFVGASPETLLRLKGAHVEVDALAGTTWNAASSLRSDKNRREHEFVAQAAFDALSQLCTEVTHLQEPNRIQIGTLSHLRQCLSARCPSDVSVFDLIARLHPSPAIGGTPSTAALNWLAQHGERRPAWYTGGFGWIDAKGDCDIACALRCGLIESQQVTLYAGAGFVAGSDPEEEFAETEAKFSPMLDALSNKDIT